jgi:hypothetical protein
MNFVYPEARRAWFAGELDLDADDIRVLLVMSESTADLEPDATTLAGFTSLDEMDAGGYARQSIANPAVTLDAEGRAVFSGDPVTFAALPNGSRAVKGAIVYCHSDGIPIRWCADSFPLSPAGEDITIPWPDGILRMS